MTRDYQKIEGAIRKIFSDSLEFPGKGGGRHTYWGEDGQDGYGDEDDDDGQPDYWYDPETWQAIYFEEEDIFEDLLEMDQEGQAYMVLQDPHGLIGEETLAQHDKYLQTSFSCVFSTPKNQEGRCVEFAVLSRTRVLHMSR